MPNWGVFVYILKWRGPAFGERLLISLIVRILNDNDIPAVFGTQVLFTLVDCPLTNGFLVKRIEKK